MSKKWRKPDRERQKWNYQVYRKMGYTAQQARKMRNRSPETTYEKFKTERPKDVQRKDLPSIPRSIVRKSRLATVRKTIKGLGITGKNYKVLKDLPYEKLLHIELSFNAMVEAAGDIRGIKIDEIRMAFGRYVIKDEEELWDVVKEWYAENVGVKP